MYLSVALARVNNDNSHCPGGASVAQLVNTLTPKVPGSIQLFDEGFSLGKKMYSYFLTRPRCIIGYLALLGRYSSDRLASFLGVVSTCSLALLKPELSTGSMGLHGSLTNFTFFLPWGGNGGGRHIHIMTYAYWRWIIQMQAISKTKKQRHQHGSIWIYF